MADQENMPEDFTPYDGPAGGWGSMKSLAEILPREGNIATITKELARQNKPDGFVCVSCAWAVPHPPHSAEFCENGAKATAWELTSRHVTPDFFRSHTLTSLRAWSDYRLEEAGRLTMPMKYDAATDQYQVVPWEQAFVEIGERLKALEPKSVVFYASGRASLETSYMYQLLARMYGNQNLPDSSNMCHESTSVGLKQSLGVPVGTCRLEDFETCDCILYFGQNVGTNSPRFLHQLRAARKRGCEIIVFNPLRERGLERFTDPQNPLEMATRSETPIATQYHQVKAGGDLAAMMGIAKWLVERDDAGAATLDHEFMAQHTKDHEAFLATARATSWDEIVAESGLAREAIEAAAGVYGRSRATIAVYGMGLTQHVKGVDNVRMVANLLLLKGNVGRPGAGASPVRGHSNVQGQRTVGITEKTELAPVDKLRELYDFEPPTEKGLDTVEACEGILDGSVRGFVSLGGNFVRAIPDHGPMEEAWARLDLSVQIATKLNRSHLIPAAGATYVLPCLGRIERDLQATGPQMVTCEDSTSVIHPSRGRVDPASPHLLSEPAIVAGIAKATLSPNPKVPWDAWVGDYAIVRDRIADTFPHFFARFNERITEPGGFWKGNKATNREWDTPSGKAEFHVPDTLNATGFEDKAGRYRLMTLRSNDQFNTTVYGYDDRFRGIRGTRHVVLMRADEIAANGWKPGQTVALVGDTDDGVDRRVEGLKLVEYDLPKGCIGGYYPELNPLIAVSHRADEAHVPAAKSVPVRIVPA